MESTRYNEKQFADAILTPREECLMSLLFGGELTEEAVCTLTDGIDIETENANYMLMLSCLGYAKGWAFFPPEIISRLKGLHRYYQVRNTMGTPWLVRQLRRLSDAGIPVMLLKGIAMRVYYAPSTPRLMWDFDVAVPEQRYEEALRLLCADKNNTVREETAHSSAIAGDAELDLHRWVFKTNGEKESDLWARAIHFDFHGIDVCVLSPEDMFIHQLDTQSRNLFFREEPDRRMKWLYDCRCISLFEGALDLKSLAVRAQELHAQYRVRMMLKLFMRCFPEAIAEEALDEAFPPSRGYDQWLEDAKNYQKTLEWYQGFQYTENSSVTPIHILRSIRLHRAVYRYLRPEMKAADPKMNFWRYFKKMNHIDSFSALSKKYLSRIRLRQRQLKAERT